MDFTPVFEELLNLWLYESPLMKNCIRPNTEFNGGLWAEKTSREVGIFGIYPWTADVSSMAARSIARLYSRRHVSILSHCSLRLASTPSGCDKVSPGNWTQTLAQRWTNACARDYSCNAGTEQCSARLLPSGPGCFKTRRSILESADQHVSSNAPHSALIGTVA